MKILLSNLLMSAIGRARAAGKLPEAAMPALELESPRQAEHGDFACNVAMKLAKEARQNPRAVAQLIIEHIEDKDGLLSKVEIAGPGFINFFVNTAAFMGVLEAVFKAGDSYGHSQTGAGRKVMVEFVSANPTGPLHVGHGRGAVLGDVMAKLLRACGFDVLTEYYLNDAGNQMATLGRSVIFRGRELMGDNTPFPENHYRGDYIIDLARQYLELPAIKDKLHQSPVQKLNQWAADADSPELGLATQMAAESILDGIKKDLADFGVSLENYFSEKSLLTGGAVDDAFKRLDKAGLLYHKDGALWFASTKLGDDKDRVVRRSNGELTYFASDIAYHLNKLNRGFSRLVDVWGADHHGYVPRVKAALKGLGAEEGALTVLLVQMVRLLRAGELVAMSTRGGQFDTLAQVVEEVGKDSARFLFLTRRSDVGLDFDLAVAKQKSMDNPVFYVQYAHTRVCSLLRKALAEKPCALEVEPNIDLLKASDEVNLAKLLREFPGLVEEAALKLEPHRLTFYLRELASLFHSYYNDKPILQTEESMAAARLALCKACGQVLKNGLSLLGVSAPEFM